MDTPCRFCGHALTSHRVSDTIWISCLQKNCPCLQYLERFSMMVAKAGQLEVVGKGATRSSGTSHLRYDLIPPNSHRRHAGRWGLGAKTHGEYNWLDGEMPGSVMIYHLEEHLTKFKARRERFRKVMLRDGVDDASCDAVIRDYQKARRDSDDDLAAVAWGVTALMYLEDERPDLLVK